MARTIVSDVFNPEILAETVQGAFAQETAFMGSVLASQGAVVVNDSFDESDPRRIGRTITVPYFNTLGEFVSNPDGNAVDFNAVGNTIEEATVARDSLGFEVTNWAQNGGPKDRDPYEEASEQIRKAGVRAMDKAIVLAASTTPLVLDVASTSNPKPLDYDLMVDGSLNFWGDEGSTDVVAAIVHSRTKVDLLKLKDALGRPLLLSANDGGFDRFCGIPLVVSDRAPLTGSTMSAVTAAGTTPPTVTLSGTPNGAHDLTIQITTGGSSNGTAKFKFKVKGGLWSDIYTVPNGGGAFVLDDSGKVNLLNGAGNKPAVDSLVGVNGATGITATFANGTYNADNVYTAKAQLKVSTQIVKKNALAFWYNRAALKLGTDKDIARDSNLAAMHLYRAAHLYRRRPEGTMPGVVSIVHNVSGY